MNVLVLGGLGFIGANLARYCLDRGDRVAVLDRAEPELQDRLRPIAHLWPRIEFIQGDMRDDALLAGALNGRDVVFNCAGQTSHTLSLTHPLDDAELNCLGNLAVLETIRRHHPSVVVVYPSSSTVVGAGCGGTIDERSCERPLDIYSADKAVAEKYYFIYNKIHGLKTVILRLPNLYGPCGRNTPEYGFINYFINLALEGRTITVYGKGTQKRNLLFVDDALEAMYRGAMDERLFGEILFVAHHQHLSVREIAEQIVTSFGRGALTTVEWPDLRRKMEIDSVEISAARFRALTGWEPRYTLEAGLKRTRQLLEAPVGRA